MHQKVIICADDEMIILLSLRNELRHFFKKEISIKLAHNGDETLQIFRKLKAQNISIPLIITDWMMPGIKGDELLREIKQSDPEIKSIVITGRAPNEVVNYLQDDKLADVILRKPWNNRELINVIAKLLPD